MALAEYVRQHKEGNDHFKLDTWQEDPDFRAMPTILASKDKWNEYIKQCNDQELTKLSIQSIHITEFISHTRTQRKLKKWTTAIYVQNPTQNINAPAAPSYAPVTAS